MSSLYHLFFTPSNKEVWVGKNSRANDKITFELSHHKDLWFHNATASGSHVILKYNENEFTREDIEYAAQLAITYSSNKTKKEVHYTECIYVEKPKRSSNGQVILLSYQTLYL